MEVEGTITRRTLAIDKGTNVPPKNKIKKIDQKKKNGGNRSPTPTHTTRKREGQGPSGPGFFSMVDYILFPDRTSAFGLVRTFIL